jgi:hypothetical protein
MARKRFIKPEFFQDLDLAEVCIEARYLYAGMWPWMDRQGLVEADPRAHRVNVFPYDEKISISKVAGWIDELVEKGFLIRFSWQGKDLLLCPTFSLHQRLFPDEKTRFNVSDELLRSLINDTGVPAQSRHLTVTVPSQSMHSTVQDDVKEKEKGIKKGGVGENKTPTPKFDFESLYQIYPRKIGKSEGMKRLEKRITDQATFDQFSGAVRRYRSECARLRTDEKYIKHWSSFVGTDEREPWRDYIPDAPISKDNAPLVASGAVVSTLSTPAPADKREGGPEAAAKVRELIASAFRYDPTNKAK